MGRWNVKRTRVSQLVTSDNKIHAQDYPIAHAIVYTALETALRHIAENSIASD